MHFEEIDLCFAGKGSWLVYNVPRQYTGSTLGWRNAGNQSTEEVILQYPQLPLDLYKDDIQLSPYFL
jgi:hypothetical protein